MRGPAAVRAVQSPQSLTRPGVLRGLVHRGGLRADVVRGGTIKVGDEVVEIS